MSGRSVGLVAGTIALAGLLQAGTARADYCRTKACDNQPAYDDVWQTTPDPPCDRDPVGCLLEGTPLWWPQTCISFSVQKDGSQEQGIDYDLAHDTILQAFQAWADADCGGGYTPSFAIADYSPASCNHIEYNQDQPNANVFLFRDGHWPYAGTDDTLALTTITYNTENAQIYDADVEINSADAEFTFSDDSGETNDDLLAVLTHECGHFLGLSHDPTVASTMYWRYSQGDLYQRTLHDDDIRGICDIFPPGDTVDTSRCAPRHGFSRECASTKSSGCGLSPRATQASSTALLARALGLVALRRRTRRRVA